MPSSPPGPNVPDIEALEQECAALRRDHAVLAVGLSHDLRAPLRAIESFSYLLEQHGAQLDAQGRDHLRRIRDASARMTRLLSRMQAWLQAGSATMRIEPVDLSLLADWCVAELRDAHPDREAQIDIAPDLHVHGDERLLKSALQELVQNAWHYTPADRPVQIRVDAERTSDGLTLRIQDRGEGFDPAYATRLGEPYQRLHTDAHSDGCGMGLAIARRIAERHGGSLRVEGRPGEGAVAFLALRDFDEAGR
jgi:light-regulated signal transduction histidine kinase (bacteriophytochrome)